MKKKIKIVKFLKTLENGAESHLYATVSQDVEPIKEGDWHIVFNVDEKEIDIRNTNKFLSTLDKKIIATTDTKLTKGRVIIGTGGTLYERIAQLSKSFLKEFVANPDGEFEVECYKENLIDESNGEIVKKGDIIINQDNTINITSVSKCDCTNTQACRICGEKKNLDGDFWKNLPPAEKKIILTRTKLKNILHCVTGNVKDFVMHEDRFINDWIKENL